MNLHSALAKNLLPNPSDEGRVRQHPVAIGQNVYRPPVHAAADRRNAGGHAAHGNVQLSGNGALADLLCEEIKAKLGIKLVRGDTFGYLQRSFIGCVSGVDQREAREVGEKAVQFAMWGPQDGSVAIQRTGFYSVDYELLPLSAVAGKPRVMEDEFIATSGTDVTDVFRMYLRPLLGSGMPDAFRLRHHPVVKVLNPGD